MPTASSPPLRWDASRAHLISSFNHQTVDLLAKEWLWVWLSLMLILKWRRSWGKELLFSKMAFLWDNLRFSSARFACRGRFFQWWRALVESERRGEEEREKCVLSARCQLKGERGRAREARSLSPPQKMQKSHSTLNIRLRGIIRPCVTRWAAFVYWKRWNTSGKRTFFSREMGENSSSVKNVWNLKMDFLWKYFNPKWKKESQKSNKLVTPGHTGKYSRGGKKEANKERRTQSKILKFYWYSNFQPFLPSFLPWHAKVEKSGNFETLKASIWFKRFGRKRCFILDRTSFHFFVTDDSHLIWGKREKGVPRGKHNKAAMLAFVAI